MNPKYYLIGFATAIFIAFGVLNIVQKNPEKLMTENVDSVKNETSKTKTPKTESQIPKEQKIVVPAVISTTQEEYYPGVKGFLAESATIKNQPGIIIIHEWWGLNNNIKSEAIRLAEQGYRVLAVDLFQGQVATVSDEARKLSGSVIKEEAQKNLAAAVNFLRQSGSKKVASLGWCFGGEQSLQLALSQTPVDATVIYYGTVETDQTKLKSITWPVLGIFGETDTVVPLDSVKKFETAVKPLNPANQIYIYPGVGHAFANPSNQNFAPAETADAWAKTKNFLAQNLKE